jgi:hypothetical protein
MRRLHQMPEASGLILHFGPHRGNTLAQVAIHDPDYVRQLVVRAQRPEVRAAAGRPSRQWTPRRSTSGARLALVADGSVRRHEPLSSSVLPPHAAWGRLRHMRRVVADQLAIASGIKLVVGGDLCLRPAGIRRIK